MLQELVAGVFWVKTGTVLVFTQLVQCLAWGGMESSQFKLKNKENLFYDLCSYEPNLTSYRISGDLQFVFGIIQAGQTATKAGHHATPGWTLCQAK